MLACLHPTGYLWRPGIPFPSLTEGAVLSATYIHTGRHPPPRLSLARTPPPPPPPSLPAITPRAVRPARSTTANYTSPSLPPLPPSLRPPPPPPTHHTTGRNMATMEGWLQVPVERNLMGRAGTWKVHSMFQNPHRKKEKKEREREKNLHPPIPPILSPPVPLRMLREKRSLFSRGCLPAFGSRSIC